MGASLIAMAEIGVEFTGGLLLVQVEQVIEALPALGSSEDVL